MNTSLDYTDPLVAALAWVLTLVVSKIPNLSRFRHLLPIVAVLAAVAIRAAMDVFEGEALSWASMARAVGSGAVAVFGHSQFREFLKMTQKAPQAPQEPEEPEGDEDPEEGDEPEEKPPSSGGATTGAAALIVFFLVAPLVGCAHGKVVRESSTYVAEIVASLSRQEAASSLLKEAATSARNAGNREACLAYAAPALRIDHRAQAEANRALFLAGLPYPDADGNLPPEGTTQEDPGDPGPFDATQVEAYCGGGE